MQQAHKYSELQMLVSFISRVTFDEEFVRNGCPEAYYDPNTNVDDTVGTYSTNFAISAVCIAVIGLKLFGGRRSKLLLNDYLMIAFFLFTCLAFGIAGVGHVVIKQVDDPGNVVNNYMTAITYSAANVFLILFSLRLIGVDHQGSCIKKSIWWTSVVIAVAVYVTTIVMSDNLLIYGFFGFFTFIFTAIIYLIKVFMVPGERLYYSIKSLGTWVMLAASFIQFLLTPKCGLNGAYKDCFGECPLPNPMKFNHNALFHVVDMIGLIMVGWSEYYSPSYSVGKNLEYEEDVLIVDA